MIFPEAKDKSNIVKQLQSLKKYLTFWRSGSDHPTSSVPPLDDHEMRRMCMELHLEPLKAKLLAGQFKEGFEIFEAVEHFTGLYQCCYCQYYACVESRVYDWEMIPIKNVSYN